MYEFVYISVKNMSLFLILEEGFSVLLEFLPNDFRGEFLELWNVVIGVEESVNEGRDKVGCDFDVYEEGGLRMEEFMLMQKDWVLSY